VDGSDCAENDLSHFTMNLLNVEIKVTPESSKHAVNQLRESGLDVQQWRFGNLQRQADGTFKNEDLANVLKAS
jgi:hypothetical protein